jgi:hemin uptake protein HemP
MMEREAPARLRSADRHGVPNTPPSCTPLRRIDSKTLLGAAQEIEIDHLGQIYRLRRTTLGKLILTK